MLDTDRLSESEGEGEGEGESKGEGNGEGEGRSPRRVQTLGRVYQDIVAGAPPWVAFNKFLHEWFAYAKDARAALVADPLGDEGPPAATEHACPDRPDDAPHDRDAAPAAGVPAPETCWR